MRGGCDEGREGAVTRGKRRADKGSKGEEKDDGLWRVSGWVYFGGRCKGRSVSSMYLLRHRCAGSFR